MIDFSVPMSLRTKNHVIKMKLCSFLHNMFPAHNDRKRYFCPLFSQADDQFRAFSAAVPVPAVISEVVRLRLFFTRKTASGGSFRNGAVGFLI
jgi:hypothetical protein